jgi:antirestriction protein
MSDTAKIYVADLAAYNNGKLVGEWLDLDDYNDSDELEEAISELMEKWSKESGETVEEYAIHDTENLPSGFVNEYMSAKDFQPYYEAKEVADYLHIPTDVVFEWMNDRGEDSAESAKDAYQGEYDDMEDFAYRLTEDVGPPSNPEYYIYISDTDRRILAGEEADSIVDSMDDDELIREAGMEDEYEEIENTRKTEEDQDYDGGDTDTDEEIKKLVEKAKEKIREEKYDEIYTALEDPVQYFVEDHGIYSMEDLMKASFVQMDYEKLATDLNNDYDEVRYDGKSYIFSSNYAKGGAIPAKKSAKDKSLKAGNKVAVNLEVVNEMLKKHPNKNSRLYPKLIFLHKRSSEEGEVYSVGKVLVGVKFGEKKVSVPKNWVKRKYFAEGGKPIGSTGLFAKGGKVSAASLKKSMKEMTVKEALEDDIIFENDVPGAKRVYKIVDKKGSNVYAITEYGKGKFSTVVNNDSEYGTLDACLEFIAKDINFDEYAAGGKPIGSTGLFEGGGEISHEEESKMTFDKNERVLVLVRMGRSGVVEKEYGTVTGPHGKEGTAWIRVKLDGHEKDEPFRKVNVKKLK